MPLSYHASVHAAIEFEFRSSAAYSDPFSQIELDVVFSAPNGRIMRVPAFWAGDHEWRVRFAPPEPGVYTFETVCSDRSNAGLHGHTGTVIAQPYAGQNPLLQHGFPQVAPDKRHFQYADGSPFFWLGDTWWMGLCNRLSWPDDFQMLAADRRVKGFSVIQIVAGLYPDMPWRDPRGANEAGYPWSENFEQINPAYFDMADLRIRWLVKSGFVPCIVGCWGYFLPWMGVNKLKQHWRYLVARWGAYPVFWCLAGEGTMPYYLSEDREGDCLKQKAGWTEVARYLREIDPYHHPITIHPTDNARDQVDDPSVLDFDMLQTGHGGYESIPNTVSSIRSAVERAPTMPAMVGEVCYEGILEGSREEIQRFMFWSTMLIGAAGFTYGANGIWQLNNPGQPFGPSPHGSSWGDIPWQEAVRLPGSTQLGLARRLLERYPWQHFEPHQDWITPASIGEHYLAPYCAGIPGGVRVIYVPRPIAAWSPSHWVTGLGAHSTHTAFLFNPKTGAEISLGTIQTNAEGRWRIPVLPLIQDWVIVIDG
ncbi:MAG: DUF4038 domain-containing protein [Anaerolineae bacterium]|nr:DUF4038 domain-containing protein [Thermoflexales bacterium]MDW8406649.1 DUF4038 domain-containing protein [Anaerolineae bacterium]